MSQPKLFMVLLGCTPPGRHVEQHDFFFGIADSINELIPAIKTFWPEGRVHIDAWREVVNVDGYQINIISKDIERSLAPTNSKLFFINLGGYMENRFEEQHYVVLTVKPNKTLAFKDAKSTLFFQQNSMPGATSHIDDKFGVDVDDIYQIEEMLPMAQKQKYRVEINAAEGLQEDAFHLGYVKLPIK